MDFDPVPVFTSLACPVLVFFGETDEWMPVDDSVAIWQRAGAGGAGTVTLVRLPGCQHLPTLNEDRSLATISPRYTETLPGWLDELLASVGA